MRLLVVATLAALCCTSPALAQSDPLVPALVRDLKSRDHEKATSAAGGLAKATRDRRLAVAGLIDAVKTGEWDRCGGDVRDAIARTLGDLEAREAVPALLEVVKSGKPIEHECAQ